MTHRTLHASLSYRYLPSVLPQDAVPVLRFCAALADGGQMAIADPGGTVFGTASGSLDPADWPRAYIECAEKLARVQELAGASFALPLEFRPEDQRDMEYARMLLCGETVHATWSGMTSALPADTASNLLRQIDAQGDLFAFVALHQETLVVAGGHVPLGVVQRWMPVVRMSNLDDVRAWHRTGANGTVQVRLVPGDDKRMTIRQIPGATLPLRRHRWLPRLLGRSHTSLLADSLRERRRTPNWAESRAEFARWTEVKLVQDSPNMPSSASSTRRQLASKAPALLPPSR